MQIKYCLIILLLITNECVAQNPWQLEMNIPPGGQGHGITQLEDSSLIVMGNVFSGFQWDGLIARISPEGDTLWIKAFEDRFLSECAPAPYDGIYLLGPGVLKLDKVTGDTIWALDSIPPNYSFSPTHDSCLIFWDAKIDSDDFTIIKTDTLGNEIFSKSFSIVPDSIPINAGVRRSSIIPVSNGGYFTSGLILDSIQLTVNSDYLFFRFDENGDTLWTLSLDIESGDLSPIICETTDDGFLIGTSDGQAWTSILDQVSIIKLDSSGNIQWAKRYGDRMDIWNIIQTSDSAYAVCGYKCDNSGYGIGVIFKIDSTGEVIWNKFYSRGNLGDFWDIVETYDKGFAITGWLSDSASEIFIGKADAFGNLGCFEISDTIISTSFNPIIKYPSIVEVSYSFSPIPFNTQIVFNPLGSTINKDCLDLSDEVHVTKLNLTSLFLQIHHQEISR